ncbi:unnamed protein product, partial [Brenthis ino]
MDRRHGPTCCSNNAITGWSCFNALPEHIIKKSTTRGGGDVGAIVSIRKGQRRNSRGPASLRHYSKEVPLRKGLPISAALEQTSELESLLYKQEGASLAPAHMDLFDGGTTSRDDAFLRPALWEDIASSIRNIDPENANMLAPLGATHVKLEADDALLEECATPLLSPLEIKTERLCAPPTYAHPQPLHHQPQQQPATSFSKYPQSRLVYMSPLTPPGSDQGSPGNSMQGGPRRTPPPPYHPPPLLRAPHVPQHPLPQTHHHPQAMPQSLQMAPQAAPAPHPHVTAHPRLAPPSVKYNRRNNPELEKRRVHHCDFIGCTKVYTKSSHLKAHQRIHTGGVFIVTIFNTKCAANIKITLHMR